MRWMAEARALLDRLAATQADAIEKAATEIASAHGVPTLGLAADLVEPGACERVVASTVERFGRLDILVANAGGPPTGYIDALDDDTWRRAFELTFLTTIRLARAALPHFVERGWGRLVVIGSGSMAAPIPNLATSSGIRPGLRAVVKLYAEQAGVKATPHTFRHQCITWLTRHSGLADAELQLVTGHARRVGRTEDDLLHVEAPPVPFGDLGQHLRRRRLRQPTQPQ